MDGPVIIEAAINGVTTQEQNPHAPRLPEEIATDALACFEAGASIVHNHIDKFMIPGDEAAARYVEGWRPVFAERPDALLYPTTNAGPAIVDAYSHLEPLAETGLLRIGIADPGSVNLGGAGENGEPGVGGVVYANSPSDIRYEIELNQRLQIGPSMAIFEPGFLRCALAYRADGRLPAGTMIKLYFGGDGGYLNQGRPGAPFGLPPTRAALEAYLELLDGCGVPWSSAVIGGDLCATEVAELTVRAGGHLHVGLEDYAGPRTPSNVELVREAVAVVEAAGGTVASCDDAARILQLPRPAPIQEVLS